MSSERLGIGFIGSGFMTRFHLRSWVAVRDADVLGIWSPNAAHREEAAAMARELGVGAARPHQSITAMVADPAIDCLWIVAPNHARLECMEEIVDAIRRGAGTLRAVACEKPLGRNVAEARRMLELAREANLLDGYLENQVFAPAVSARPRDAVGARRARRRSGPTSPAPPRSTAARTTPGSGAASCRAAACSPT